MLSQGDYPADSGRKKAPQEGTGRTGDGRPYKPARGCGLAGQAVEDADVAAEDGRMLLSKKVWFPKDGISPDILPDGTVTDTCELARSMMGGAQTVHQKRRVCHDIAKEYPEKRQKDALRF